MTKNGKLSEAYRTSKLVRRPEGQGLNDPYVRFFRMAERRITEKTGQGVVCFISNYSWLDGLSFTGMRERYLEAFDSVYIDNLHGDRIISEYAPDGRTSETVFSMRGQSPRDQGRYQHCPSFEVGGCRRHRRGGERTVSGFPPGEG